MPDERLLNPFLLGNVVMACAIAGLFFLRFFRRTGDRLFAAFAAAFWLLGLNWLALAFAERDEVRTALYYVRGLAFVVVIVAIVAKNRRR